MAIGGHELHPTIAALCELDAGERCFHWSEARDVRSARNFDLDGRHETRARSHAKRHFLAELELEAFADWKLAREIDSSELGSVATVHVANHDAISIAPNSEVLAAHRAGLKDVILPKRNEDDLDDVPEQVREEIAFHPVETIDEALAIALEAGGVDEAAA